MEGDRLLDISVGWSKGLSVEPTRAVGRLTLDPDDGSVSVEVAGLDPDRPWDVWLVENVPGPGRSVMPDAADEMVLLGTLRLEGGDTGRFETRHDHRLETRLDHLGAGFLPDLVVVTRGGEGPGSGGVLYGVPSLFERLRARQRSGAATEIERLVSLGEELFLNETFAGNGRTCATCHPPLNNFTVDPEFIAALPSDDPLFVAEQLPALGENFEDPVLMRAFGLVLENPDGFDDLPGKFVMRSVSHMLSVSQSIAPSYFDSTGGGDVPPFERTGWGGDGAPGSGTLREFPIGAIVQHFTRTLNRDPATDFRFPTDTELDALEAFTLSLGRQADPDLAGLRLADPVDRAGRDLFMGSAQCFECHSNGGANADFVDLGGNQNVNFDTGVEHIVHPAELLGRPLPPDAGFGRDPHPGGGFGDGKFNTQPVIEAADTAPFFHHHGIATLEEAVAFYTTEEFANSPAGVFVAGISLTDAEVLQVAAFLRTINGLENIRSATRAAERAKAAPAGHGPLGFCVAEIGDAVRVLEETGRHLVALTFLRRAADYAGRAASAESLPARNAGIDAALADLEGARRRIQDVSEGVVEEDPPQVAAGRGRLDLRVAPNPAAGHQAFLLDTRQQEFVTLEVFDVRGRRVAAPFAGAVAPGGQRIPWSGRAERGNQLPPGVYFVRASAAGETRTVRFVRTAAGGEAARR